jgi:pimeloyl-ACP methyl ester carboxylesterase
MSDTQTSDTEDTEFVIPQVYKHHAFACFTQRPPGHPRGSCGALGAQPLWDRLGKSLEGGGIVDEYREKRKIPTLLHFAENDPLIPFEEVAQFRAHRPDVSAFSYPSAGHGFNCDERNSYNEEAAQMALDRTMFWIGQYVEGQPPIALKNAGSYAQAKTDKKKKKKEAADLGPPMD